MTIQEKVINFINKYDLSDKTIIVGFSGGYDSMCLLDVLYKIKQNENFDDLKIIAAHFNHNWRGEESYKEQEICRMFAASKGFEFYTKKASGVIKKTENEARLARYEFFEDAYEDYDADAVFTAHNKDDNAETILYRTIKGTGLIGLRGISEKREYFYRPLLKINRSEIVNYCEENNLTPNQDSSNNNTNYNRNYIRLNVIPSLEKINPAVKDSLNTLAEVAFNENSIIEEYLSKLRDKIFTEDYGINPEEYKKLSQAVKMRFLHEFIQRLDLDYDLKKIKDIYNFIEENIDKKNGTTVSLATTLWLYVDNKSIEIIPQRHKEKSEPHIEVELAGEGDYEFEDKILTLKRFKENEIFVFPNSTANYAYIDMSSIKLPLTIRYRRDGDIISPFGMTGSMKLKKFFNSKAVTRHKRDKIILLANENDILWAAGVGISNKIGVTDKPTHVIEISTKVVQGE